MVKTLLERRAAHLEELSSITKNAETEKRAFDEKELARVKELQAEVAKINDTIKVFNESRAFNEPVDEEETKERVVSIRDEIRALTSDKELDITNMEVRATGADLTGIHTYGTVTDGAHSSTAVGNIGKTTYADYIMKGLEYISPLFGRIRHESFASSKHQIPMQKDKLGKFVPMKELEEYAKTSANFDYIVLEPKKYGTMIQMSEESLEDTGYNIEAELLNQFRESYGLTLDELIVTGDANVFGLNNFDAATDKSHEIPMTAVNSELFVEMFYALPIKYRKSATWVISDAMAKEITKLKDADGRPLFIPSWNGSPFGESGTILGRPVIINDNVADASTTGNKPIFFGDLQKALIIGNRKAFTIKKSTEYGFIDDSIAIKGSVRLDIKAAITDAMAYAKVQ